MQCELPKCCVELRKYLRKVVHPAGEEFMGKLDRDDLSLHDVVKYSGIVAATTDYMIAVLSAAGHDMPNAKVISGFDKRHSVGGAKYLNHKFRLAYLASVALRHTNADRQKDSHVVYGGITIRSMVERGGKVYFRSKRGHYIDFCRIVLRPLFEIFEQIDLGTCQDAYDFVLGEYTVEMRFDPYLDDDDPATAIDRMIEHCHPACLDCGEDSDECECEHFRYPEGAGECRIEDDEDFDFDLVMSQISGAYTPDK